MIIFEGDMISEYYKIIGVSPNASLLEIKSAYRTKAKKLHPDVNPSASAHQQFVILNKAYTYICDYKAGKIKPLTKAYEPKGKSNNPSQYQKPDFSQQQWNDQEQAKAYARAKAAKEKKEAEASAHFDYYVGFGLLAIIAFQFIRLIFFPVSFPLVFQMALLIAFAFPYRKKILKIIRGRGFTNIKSFLNAGVKAANNAVFSIVFGFLLTFITFFTIALNTFIPLYATIALYLTAFLLPMALEKFFKKGTFLYLRTFIAPLCLNLLFLLNFTFSGSPVVEEYEFFFEEDQGSNNVQHYKSQTSFIYLKDNTYEEYVGLRLFADFKQMAGKDKVMLQIEEGLLGFRVLKEFRFS
jgi:hypothetical protein